MRRRAFVGLVGSAPLLWPAGALSQQAQIPVVGFLRSTSAAGSAHLVEAFRRGLKESGTVFAIPTYVYILSLGALIVWGFIQVFGGDLEPLVPVAERYDDITVMNDPEGNEFCVEPGPGDPHAASGR